MGAFLQAIIVPMMIKAVEDGVAFTILGDTFGLIQKLIPLAEDPKVKAALIGVLNQLRVGPGRPEDPGMQHAAGNKPGGH